jgi:hypothetical protein
MSTTRSDAVGALAGASKGIGAPPKASRSYDAGGREASGAGRGYVRRHLRGAVHRAVAGRRLPISCCSVWSGTVWATPRSARTTKTATRFFGPRLVIATV